MPCDEPLGSGLRPDRRTGPKNGPERKMKMGKRRAYKWDEWPLVDDYDVLTRDSYIGCNVAISAYEAAGGKVFGKDLPWPLKPRADVSATWTRMKCAETNGRSLEPDEKWIALCVDPAFADERGVIMSPWDVITITRRNGTTSDHVVVRPVDLGDRGFGAVVVDAPESDDESDGVASYVYRLLKREQESAFIASEWATRFVHESGIDAKAWLAAHYGERAKMVLRAECVGDSTAVLNVVHAVDGLLLDTIGKGDFE